MMMKIFELTLPPPRASSPCPSCRFLVFSVVIVLVIALLLAVAISYRFAALRYKRGRGGEDEDGRQRQKKEKKEGFAADEMRVLHVAPAASSSPLIVEHDPSRVALAPSALKPLERYADAGIRVREVRGGSGSDDDNNDKDEQPRHVFRATDALRMYMLLKYGGYDTADRSNRRGGREGKEKEREKEEERVGRSSSSRGASLSTLTPTHVIDGIAAVLSSLRKNAGATSRARTRASRAKSSSSVLAVLPSPDNDQHFVVVGNWASLPSSLSKKTGNSGSRSGDDGSDTKEEDDKDKHTYTLVHLFRALRRLQQRSTEKKDVAYDVRFVCRDEADVHMLTVVLESVRAIEGNGGDGAYYTSRDQEHHTLRARTIVDLMVRPRLKFVDSLEALGTALTRKKKKRSDGEAGDDTEGGPVVVFSFLGARAPLWTQLRGARVVWYSYADEGSLDLTLAKHFLPFLSLANVDISIKTNEMQETKGDRRVYGLLTVPALLHRRIADEVEEEEEEEHPMLLAAAIALVYSVDGDAIRTQDVATQNNMFAMWFPFCEATRKVLAKFNADVYARRLNSGTDGSEFYTHGLPLEVVTGDRERALRVGRPDLSILEQFAEEEEVQKQQQPPPSDEKEEEEEEGGEEDDIDIATSAAAEENSPADALLTIEVTEPSTVHGFVDYIHGRRVKRARVVSPASPSPTGEAADDASSASAFVRGIPVRPWDRVRLKNQTPGLLNGLFYVAAIHPHSRSRSLATSTIELHDAIVLHVDPSNGDVTENLESSDSSDSDIAAVKMSLAVPKKKADADAEAQGRRSPRLVRRLRELGSSDRVYFVDLDAEATPTSSSSSSSSSSSHRRFVLNPDDVRRIRRGKAATEDDEAWEDDAYSCLSNVTVKNPARCRELEGGRGVWDRPCRTDAECPFFQANRRYPNYRGGCEGSGVCEMPLGVRRVGYRLYDPVASLPLCHACDDPLDAECCAKQQPFPDYAFPLDEMQRRRYL